MEEENFPRSVLNTDTHTGMHTWVLMEKELKVSSTGVNRQTNNWFLM